MTSLYNDAGGEYVDYRKIANDSLKKLEDALSHVSVTQDRSLALKLATLAAKYSGETPTYDIVNVVQKVAPGISYYQTGELASLMQLYKQTAPKEASSYTPISDSNFPK